MLERENSAYRIINDEIIPITSEQEIQSIETALKIQINIQVFNNI